MQATRILVTAGLALWSANVLAAAESIRPAIIDAAKSGDKAALRALIQKKVNVNVTDADGSTALQWASYRDDIESADLLIRAGANANAANDLGVTPLWPASENGSARMVGRLLAAGANPNVALLSGETPLMVAARSGYPAVVELLLNKGAHPNAHGTRAQTALMWAVAQKHPDVVKVLIAHKADLQLKSDVWSEVMAIPPHGYLPYNKAIPHGGETALMFAARLGDLESAKLLVAAGANVNDADAWGVSATTLAAHSGFTELVLFLLDKGADPNAAPNGFTALHEAVMRRDETMVKALLDHGANANTPLETWTPTRRSSDDWHFEASLIGATPYWLAARFNEPEIMRMLAAHGADPKFVLHVKWQASTGVGSAPKSETATTLQAALGVVADAGGRDGGGVQTWVPNPPGGRESRALETAKLLVDSGVDVNAAGEDGRTALDGAKRLKYETVVAYLTEHGAKPGTGANAGNPRRPAER